MSEADNKPTEVTPKTDETPKTVTEQATEAAAATASAVKDNVFSMFGGGPKKEKAEEKDEGADEPSGSSKAAVAKPADDVRCPSLLVWSIQC
jgi:Ran-binding protein 1